MRTAITTESASHYLSPPEQYFWRWGDDGEVFTWADGSTIAFRDELLHALEHLAPRGLPPLGAVLLVMAACRENWQGDGGSAGSLSGLNRLISQLDLQNSSLPEAWLPQILRTLDEIHKLPRDLRTLPHYKNALIGMVFESAHIRVSPTNAGDVLRLLSEGFCPEPSSHDAASLRLRMGATFQQDMQCLHGAFMQVHFQALEHRLRTGMDAPPEEADVDLPSVERIGQLMDDLAADPEHGGLVRVARNLMALTFLPRKMSEPEESSVGGVSDISNRGTLDRLLVSELANDDTTLAIRVALNEALYLRRESPPQAPVTSRMILLDTGIRLWGLPRVFAASAALAFAASLERGAQLVVHRTAGRDVEPADLASRAGLTEQLEALSSEAQPGAALAAWGAEWQGLAHPEPLIITHATVLADPDFRAALATAAREVPVYVATVTAAGSFAIHVVQGRGSRQLRGAELELDRLLAPPEPNAPRRRPSVPAVRDRWPAGLLTDAFPLYLPYSPRYSASYYCAGVGLACATPDRRLLLWSSAYHGARELTARLPAGKVKWLRLYLDGTISLLIASRSEGLRLFTHTLSTGESRIYDLEGNFEQTQRQAGTIQGVFDHVGCIYVVNSDQVSVYSKEGGTFLDLLKVEPGLKWQHDRFFHNWQNFTWHTPIYDGRRARWQDVPLTHLDRPSNEDVLSVFDRSQLDGPWALLTNGNVVSTLGVAAQSVPFAHRMDYVSHLLAASRDGNRLIVLGSRKNTTAPQKYLLDLQELTITEVRGKLEQNLWSLESASYGMTQTFKGLRRRFAGVTVTADGEIGLVSASGSCVTVTLDEASGRLLLQPQAQSVKDKSVMTFQQCAPPEHVHLTVREAKWPDGSRAFLDSRGLLHLLSSDETQPSIAIALHDMELAVWLSDGRRCGHRYFIGDSEATATAEVMEVIGDFTGRLAW